MNNIDLIIYINLDKRTDRKEETEKEFERLSIDPSKIYRFSAISNEEQPDVGCSTSHKEVMKYIIQLPETIKTILVLEDDFSFCDDSKIVHKSVEQLFNNYPSDSWDVVFFACIVKQKKNYDELLSIALNCSTTAGYLIKKEYASILLNNIEEGIPLLTSTRRHWEYAIDVYWNSLLYTERWFYFNHFLGYQRYSYSDLSKVHTTTKSQDL